MLLTGDEIKSRNCIENSHPDQFYYTSYNLRIGRVINSDGTVLVDEKSKRSKSYVQLGPREIIWVVSQEVLRMPENLTGSLSLVNQLSKKGLLAINVGVVDPSYHGPLSTALVNFSDQNQMLRFGQRYMRVIFFEHNTPEIVRPYVIDYESYTYELQDTASRSFSKSFLGLLEVEHIVRKSLRRDFWRYLAQGVVIFAIFVSFVSLLPNVLIDRSRYNELEKSIIGLEKKIEKLQ